MVIETFVVPKSQALNAKLPCQLRAPVATGRIRGSRMILCRDFHISQKSKNQKGPRT
jgi:hypothetical protein